MKKLKSCEFNLDTNCVELTYTDGTMLAIDTIAAGICRSRLERGCGRIPQASDAVPPAGRTGIKCMGAVSDEGAAPFLR